MVSNNVSGSFKIKGEFDRKEDRRRSGHRKASVLRYKQKRQNRLFSKRIRYEVKKLNAEKRPRLKGRFVKNDFLPALILEGGVWSIVRVANFLYVPERGDQDI